MKKLILAFAVMALTSNAAFSQDDETDLMAASPEYILGLLEQCKSDAVEDEITKPEMNSYLLTCINDELEASYYEPIKVLPKAN